MGLLRLIARLFGLGDTDNAADSQRSDREQTESGVVNAPAAASPKASQAQAEASPSRRKLVGIREGRPLKRGLAKLRYRSSLVKTPSSVELHESSAAPYEFARFGPFRETYLDLSKDADPGWLAEFGLPELQTPADLAEFLQVPLGELAWLANRCLSNNRPESLGGWHYTPKWIPKSSGGFRLLEIPKPKLKNVQQSILENILNLIPPHRSAHGFVRGRSAVTNADAHVGAGVIYKIDLENFYGTVKLSRVVAIFRTIGFSREVAMWLAYLTTSLPPHELRQPSGSGAYRADWATRHLPQGAATSPALANLSAYSLDIRIAGLAKKYGAVYTRYADDLTISGPRSFAKALRQFIPLCEQIVGNERFRVNKAKRRVLRSHQRLTVTGIVVNEHVNMSRREYDRLKATLHNCIKHGPASQNRDDHPNFEAHIRGRVAYACQLNPQRGAKLQLLLDQVRWG